MKSLTIFLCIVTMKYPVYDIHLISHYFPFDRHKRLAFDIVTVDFYAHRTKVAGSVNVLVFRKVRGASILLSQLTKRVGQSLRQEICQH